MRIPRQILVMCLLIPAGISPSPLYLGKSALCETVKISRPDTGVYGTPFKKAFPVLLAEAQESAKSRAESIDCYRNLNIDKKELHLLMKNHLARVDYALEIFSRKLRSEMKGYQTRQMNDKTDDFIKTKYQLYARLHDKSQELLAVKITKADDREDLLNIYLAIRRLHYDFYSSLPKEERSKLTFP